MADDGDTPQGEIGSPPPATPSGVINLTTVLPTNSGGGGGGSAGGGQGTATAVTSDYNIDKTRQWIAFILLGILGFIILIQLASSVTFAQGCWNTAAPDPKTGVMACSRAQAALDVMTSVLGTIFTAMIGLVGSVVGFYFGSQKAGQAA